MLCSSVCLVHYAEQRYWIKYTPFVNITYDVCGRVCMSRICRHKFIVTSCVRGFNSQSRFQLCYLPRQKLSPASPFRQSHYAPHAVWCMYASATRADNILTIQFMVITLCLCDIKCVDVMCMHYCKGSMQPHA